MEEIIQELARNLANRGLKYAFGITGSGLSLSLITELERLGVHYYSVSHEASGALMAGVVSRMPDAFGTSISIKGPGLANMFPGIVSNHFEGNPALSISEAFGENVPFYHKHKRLDHIAFLKTIVKGYVRLDGMKRLEMLLRHARSEAPGPVHLDLSSGGSVDDMPLEILEEPRQVHSGVRGKFYQLLRNSERPIVVVGSLALRRCWREQLSALNIPVFTTAAAKGGLNERLPNSAGVYTGVGKQLTPEFYFNSKADLLVGIGLRNTEMLSVNFSSCPIILIDEIDQHLGEGFGSQAYLSIFDQNLIPSILGELQEKCWGLEELGIVKQGMRKKLIASNFWLPPICFDVLNSLDYPHGLILDTGSFCTVGEHLWFAGLDREFVGSSNGRSMGISIPSAVGLAISKPGYPVFCVVGDGGIRMYPAEIKLAVQECLPVCFILMTDGLFGSIACTQMAQAKSRNALIISQPSWIKAVEAMGCEAHRVNSESEFSETIETWDRTTPLFIEATFTPEAYEIMTQELR